ncbi:EAL domain-containing protein [Candidatus Albibeggiatoa sp. nov. BB20]|uniref:EAL domain-containing response regulator n=1 Tax=Candidatus Albibeggiatoa sp. nov. BB20 TaxID=3162723 RepID=UPI00336549B8
MSTTLPNPPERDKSIILIVDDEIVSRYTVKILLESEGYNLIFAESGEEALEKAQSLMPDVMLLDVMMPEMDGFQVCQHLRANPRLAELPVVMVTALDDRESRLKGLEVGADDFMSKPFDKAELRARIRTITRLNRYRRLVETEEQLAYLANYDVLTGLPNRNLLLERLRQMIRRAHNKQQQSIIVLTFDLDGFQMVNDSFGSALGDKLLCEIAHRVTQSVPSEASVARLGGDEFVVILESYNPVKDVGELTQQLLERISQPINLNQHEIVITGSIGISVYPNDGKEALTLLNNADTAMSRAKTQGKNTYQFFTNEMNVVSFERLILENQLRKVLFQDEMRLYYQPQIDLNTGQIIGVEALLRWQHPELGLRTPDKFVPVLEEMGLIIQVGGWVLRTACEQNYAWQQAGFEPICVSVNMSGRQFQQADLLSSIENILVMSRLAPQYLELELTESMLMTDDQDKKHGSFATFSRLQKMGVKIAIDDFGTGYSSLSYLKRFPVNTLKIDRSFVKDVCINSDDAAITDAIIAMAHSLQLDVVAEGVETRAQSHFLQAKGCEYAQGYLFSPPVDADKMTELLYQTKINPYPFSKLI